MLTRYSNELARQSIRSLDAALKARLVSDVATKFDTQFYVPVDPWHIARLCPAERVS